MMGPHAEELSPFGSMMNEHIDDDAQDLPGAMVTADNTINVLDSPFASSCIHEDQANEPKQSPTKATGNKASPRPINGNTSSSSATSSVQQSSSSVKTATSGTDDVNNEAVANILESPFVSACLDPDELARAITAEELASATAAVHISNKA